MEIYVRTQWNGHHYRATYGKCSIMEARRYYKHQRSMVAWVEEKTGQSFDKLDLDDIVENQEDVHLAIDTWLALAEILAALRGFEKGKVQDPGDEHTEPIVKWEEAEFPTEWAHGYTAADTMPYEFFEASLYASRKLNPGLFPTSPDFLARSNVQTKGTA